MGAAVSFDQKAYAPYLVDVQYGVLQAAGMAVKKDHTNSLIQL